jgi:hypothetical protein
VSRNALTMSKDDRTEFRDSWTEEMAKQGTFERFERACDLGLTPSGYECAMASATADGVATCMKMRELGVVDVR